MIKRVKSTILDRKFLNLRSIEATSINVDFSKLVVNKPWGYEYRLTSTPLVEIWHLSLDHGTSTSMHCHPNKKTALVVLDGRAQFSTLNKSIKLGPMDAVTIDSGVFHSTQCVSKRGLKLIEIETPPMKHDLIRLEDKYGRANTGYEGLDKMKTSNGSYPRFKDKGSATIQNFCNSHLNISFVDGLNSLKKSKTKKDVAVLINGFIKSLKGNIVYTTGDVVPINDLRMGKYSFRNVSMLSIQKGNKKPQSV